MVEWIVTETFIQRLVEASAEVRNELEVRIRVRGHFTTWPEAIPVEKCHVINPFGAVNHFYNHTYQHPEPTERFSWSTRRLYFGAEFETRSISFSPARVRHIDLRFEYY